MPVLPRPNSFGGLANFICIRIGAILPWVRGLAEQHGQGPQRRLPGLNTRKKSGQELQTAVLSTRKPTALLHGKKDQQQLESNWKRWVSNVTIDVYSHQPSPHFSFSISSSFSIPNHTLQSSTIHQRCPVLTVTSYVSCTLAEAGYCVHCHTHTVWKTTQRFMVEQVQPPISLCGPKSPSHHGIITEDEP